MQLSIPSVNISAPFEAPLGLTERGTVAIPEAYTTVGWYKYGPTPGALGPSVVLGHVDSVDGPAVFFSLGQVNIGDNILIDREDGSTVVFEITELERIRQGDFPTQKVYGNIPYAGIRLITCTGIYDKGVQRYSHNLIVYGTLKEIQHSDGTIETDTAS
jgi:sortase (surface protein transpeptidase)